MSPLVITLDGPAGSGKSTVARRLAKRLGLEFLDTGAMYRGLTAHCLDHGVIPARQPQQVVETAQRSRMRFDWKADPPRLYINGKDITARLRDADVTYSVSDVAAMAPVREVLVREQQQIGLEHRRLVTEGRDQGSVVFPDAQVKFYLDASPQVRAHRRAAEMTLAGKPVDPQEVLRQIVDRDRRDSTRPDGPLICPQDAMRIDTTDMTLDDVVDMLEKTVRHRMGAALIESASPGS